MIEFIGKDHRLAIEKRESYIPEIAPFREGAHVYLQTCNRVELYRGDGIADKDIVEHLFRVVSGLESAMIGESHIQGQVKRAYGESIDNEHISGGLHRLFRRPFAVASEFAPKREFPKALSRTIMLRLSHLMPRLSH